MNPKRLVAEQTHKYFVLLNESSDALGYNLFGSFEWHTLGVWQINKFHIPTFRVGPRQRQSLVIQSTQKHVCVMWKLPQNLLVDFN